MTTERVAIRVDAAPSTGVGHAIRCLALAQELLARGVPVTVFGEFSVPWVTQAYAAAGLAPVPAGELSSAPVSHAVLDGYDLSPQVGIALRDRGIRLLALADGDFGAGQVADLYLDQNLAARLDSGRYANPQAEVLAGTDYTLFRDEVLQHRRELPWQESAPPTVLAVFGGTDPYDAAATVVPLLLETGKPMALKAIAAQPATADALRRLPVTDGQHLEVLGPQRDLAAVAAGCDAAVSAAGSTVWELACLGVPTAVVCVVDNQEPGYAAALSTGVVGAAGRLEALRSGDPAERRLALDTLTRLTGDPAYRGELAQRGRSRFDGLGRRRVVDRLLAR
ncbi:spore coat protein [Calidifontibacter sp. DB0510]|uniref:Spore coat protein n=1 Tax=Metallococcus carri TaxID=1656884 RepID=A0A967AX47_9MICO|nr:spore coat protein [Metallococcus carri]NHN54606.1 spore coat protein [Metallococcus carri]NOP36555.1 spore coat protein [Calidifontibacter sp. DB2511S]